MVREGLNSYLSGDTCTHDLFGERTAFRMLCKNFVRNAVASNTWFAFHTKASKKQVDILKVESDSGITLGNMVNAVSPYNSVPYKISIYKYLMAEFMCYIEYPIVRKSYQSNEKINSFEKLLVTSNINVVAEWLGMSVEDAQVAYGSRLNKVCEDNECGLFPYVKLYTTKDGTRKVTKPRSDLDLGIGSGIRLVPVFALKEGVDVLYSKLLKGSYSVSFVKDSGQERTINTSFNKDLVLSYYKDHKGFVNRNFETVYQGSFINNPNLARGYIRVFELGSSIYDTATRSINYARITSIVEEEPNMAYVGIDLSKVVSTFEECVVGMSESQVSELVGLLEDMNVGASRMVGKSLMSSSAELLVWVKAQETLLSTVFLRDLALFMIGFPEFFNGYTGGGLDNQEDNNEEPQGLQVPEDFELDFM